MLKTASYKLIDFEIKNRVLKAENYISKAKCWKLKFYFGGQKPIAEATLHDFLTGKKLFKKPLTKSKNQTQNQNLENQKSETMWRYFGVLLHFVIVSRGSRGTNSKYHLKFILVPLSLCKVIQRCFLLLVMLLWRCFLENFLFRDPFWKYHVSWIRVFHFPNFKLL